MNDISEIYGVEDIKGKKDYYKKLEDSERLNMYFSILIIFNFILDIIVVFFK